MFSSNGISEWNIYSVYAHVCREIRNNRLLGKVYCVSSKAIPLTIQKLVLRHLPILVIERLMELL